MALSFRNTTTDPVSPVATWPTEAVQAALERGDLGDWQRLAAEIGREPWGRTALQVEEVLSHSRPYGVAEAMEAVITRARARVQAGEDVVLARGGKRIARLIPVTGPPLRPGGFVPGAVDDSFFDPSSDAERAGWE